MTSIRRGPAPELIVWQDTRRRLIDTAVDAAHALAVLEFANDNERLLLAHDGIIREISITIATTLGLPVDVLPDRRVVPISRRRPFNPPPAGGAA